MTITKPLTSQIDTSDIENTVFASKTSVNAVQANLSSFASYANSTFSSGGGGAASGNGVVFSDSFTTSNVTTNQFTLSASVSYGQNLLVYLNGLLQHPDAYVVSANSLTLINTEPLPSGLKIGVRELSVAGGVANAALANTSEARAANSANGSLTFDYQGANLYVYDGVAEGGYYIPLTQTFAVLYSTQAQGSVSGYTSGGGDNSVDTIDKFSFTSDGNATDVGNLTQIRTPGAGQSSTLSGYTSGGLLTPPGSTRVNVVDKFPFSADSNATDVGDLTVGRQSAAGHSSNTSGYTSAGYSSTNTNIIDKFPFSADANATDVGDTTVARHWVAGQSSASSGYTTGGNPVQNTIDKFLFSADGNSTDVGDLSTARLGAAGQNSFLSGYTSGGSPTLNTIDKFPFAADANASDVGDLTELRNYVVGQSSVYYGYTSGGQLPTLTNIIDKFPFSTDASSTDVGDLTQARFGAAGQQV
jgi:hypothetical protein